MRPSLLLAVPAVLLSAGASFSAAPDEQPIYAGAVQKIIDSRCLSCHTPEKKKGKLIMTSLDLLTKGGDSGKPGIVPGKSAESEIYRRITLPKDDDDHMPPAEKPQPSEKEIAVLKWWIDAGAKADTPIKNAGVPDDLKAVVLELAAKVVEQPKEAPKPVITPKELDQATKDAIAKVSQSLGVTILQLSQSDTGLMFTAVNVADKFDDTALAQLAPLAGSLADVNLARTKVTDAGMATVGLMKNLQRLRLENTAITDAGLDALKACENLEYLNLFNTAVTDAGLEKLAPLKKLKRLYAWQTKATKEGAEKLHAQNEALIINLGWDQEIGRPAIKPVVIAAAGPPPPEPPPTPKVDPKDPEASFFAARILPVLERNCTACHGTEKQKNKFQAHTYELLLKGGEDNGAGIVPGKPDESAVIKRISLPLDHDDHMPPKDKPQPTEKEIGLLKWWVAQGADAAKKVKDTQVPAELN
jgi:mono/diheme cytochrome c family protein